MSVLSGRMPGCLFWTISNMNLLGFPRTTGCRPDAVATAATMEPVPDDEKLVIINLNAKLL